MKNNKIYAVFTGDIIGSSRFDAVRDDMLLSLKNSFKNIEKIVAPKEIICPFEIYRGDSFQGVVSVPEAALSIAMGIRASLLSSFRNSKYRLDARIAIGIGTIDYLPEDRGLEGTGDAFIQSGKTLDNMKKGEENLIIRTPWAKINEELQTECSLLDALINRWTYEQSQAVLKQIQGMKQQDIAKELGISQSAVGQRLKTAGARAHLNFISRYKLIIEKKIKYIPYNN